MLFHPSATKIGKPNRLDKDRYPNKDTNEEYHLDYAKWAWGAANDYRHQEWIEKTVINKRFYKGDQWIEDEDLEAFLKDSTGEQRNRIKVIHNIVRPMVEQYRGNAIRLKINATARSVSKMAITRKDEALAEQIFKTEVSNEFEEVGEALRANDQSIGRDEAETTAIFENLYVDQYSIMINRLLRYVSNLNKFENQQVRISENLALSGLGVNRAFQHGGHQRYRVVESDEFWFDRDAREKDLTDASFMGTQEPMDPALIFEKWENIPDEQKRYIENYVSENSEGIMQSTINGRAWNQSRVPVVSAYWRDTEKYKYGWVLDENGYELLTKIDYVYPGEDEARYTDKDVIDPPESPKNKRLFKKKNTRNMYVDVLRYAVFIPGEAIATEAQKSNPEHRYNDILLEFGLDDYQETSMLDISNVKFPFKCSTWGYVDGEVFSPVDDAINPQRLINRVLSVAESQLNNAGGSGPVIDESTIGSQDIDEIRTSINQGDAITLHTKGKGIPNSIGQYDASPSAGTYKMFDMIPIMENMLKTTTGINEGLSGQSTGSDQLVGVTELMIQRGSLMQEPFYAALADVFLQMYQHTATVGKRFYIDNERELAIAVGDDGLDILKLAKDMRNEDFRTFIKRENVDTILTSQANQMLGLFFELQLIDKATYANLYDRSTPEEVTFEMRKRMGEQQELQRRQAQEDQAMNQQMQAQEQQMMQQQQAQEQQMMQQQQAQDEQGRLFQRAERLENNQHEINKIDAKGSVDMRKEIAKG